MTESTSEANDNGGSLRNSFPPIHDYVASGVGNNRIDSLSHASKSATYPASMPPDRLSPFSSDYNPSYNESPHSNVPGHLDSPHDTQPTSVFGDMNAIAATPSGGAILVHHRTSAGTVDTQVYNQPGNGNGSETWSPLSSRGQNHRDSEESLQNREGDHGNHKLIKEEGDGSKIELEDIDRPPPWSELKTKAGKERKRLPLACIACRRKKIRCSGEKPACKHCLRSRIPCVYKVTTRKAAPRTDYMAMLDKRLKRMEERVIKTIPNDDLLNLSSTGRSVVKPALPGQTSKPAKSMTTKKRSADEAFTMELDEWTQSRSPNSLAEIANRSRNQKDGENKLLTEGAEFLPSTELQHHLAEVFFDCIYGQSYLLLHKPSFMRKLKSGNVPPVLVLAVCAIAARFSTHPQVGGEPAFLRGEIWSTPARAIVERRHFEPNITILIVMLILGLHYFGTCEGGLSWSFGGQAMRMAYALQLHRELDHDPLGRKKDKASELSFTDREIRRRTMWGCFLMDRFNSSGTERPSFGNEDYLQIQLPIKESHFLMEIPGPTEDLSGGVPNPIAPGLGQVSNPGDNMGVAAYVIRAVVLWGRIVKYLNLGGKEKDPFPIWSPQSEFADLRRQVDSFQESIPPLLVYNAENLQNHAAERIANQFLYLHIICHQNVLFLNRFAIPVSPGARPPKDMPKQFLSDAGRAVVDAARQISLLIEQAAGYLLTVPFAGYCAYAASTVQVWGIFSKNSQLEASSKENLRHNYKYLNKMKKYWGMFHYMAESVKDIYRHFADAANKGPTTADGTAQGVPMFMYGDWFDKYPHGVSRAGWEDPDPEIKKEPGVEAVMSQRSELQSVEEFFASLSPPSKAGQARKTTRKRLKSVGEHKRGSNAKENPPNSDLHRQQNLPSLLPNPTSQQFNPDYMDTSQSVYQQAPASAFNPHQANFDFGASPTATSFNPTNSLPQLDRQIVFGAYADMDPVVALSHNSGLDSLSMWAGIDMNGMNTDGSYESSSAWFMPFNIEPPQIDDGGGGGAGIGGLGNELFMGDYALGDAYHHPQQSGGNNHNHSNSMGGGLDGNG